MPIEVHAHETYMAHRLISSVHEIKIFNETMTTMNELIQYGWHRLRCALRDRQNALPRHHIHSFMFL